MAANQDLIVDVDKSYDPASKLTLDEHRQKAFAALQQPGFGGRAAAQQAAPQAAPQPVADPAPEAPAAVEE
jgi:hypothetical protein